LNSSEPLPIGLELMLITTLEDESAVAEAKILIDRSQQQSNSRAIIEIISTIMFYKFTSLTRTEVEAMIGIPLQQTRVYQDAKVKTSSIPRNPTSRRSRVSSIAPIKLDLCISINFPI
jgi:predicted transposase YdaD